MSRNTHMRMSIAGYLKNKNTEDMAGDFTDDSGREMSGHAVKAFLIDELGKGRKYLPMCDPSECPDFDYAEHGCPGHETSTTTPEQS